MRVHFIAIGGAIMHNLAITLKQRGYEITGSDDQIYDPARGNLSKNGILPQDIGFQADKIHDGLDAIILGMHAKADNPELIRATELGIPIYSFPEFVYREAANKRRVVIAGSHGKTTVTSMIMHVLQRCGMDFDYLVGAAIKGFPLSVKLTAEAPVILLEGDEYLSSPIDRVPKFLHYKPDIALITGIAWDHINVFPTFKEYFSEFVRFSCTINKGGSLVYNAEDAQVERVSLVCDNRVQQLPYRTPPHRIIDGQAILETEVGDVPLKVFGSHNMNNLEGARLVCRELGVSDADFYQAIQDFEGAGKRLELLRSNETTAIYRDFAHAPSKVKATVEAVKQTFPDRELTACLELHTFSSMNREFLGHYAESMEKADHPMVFFSQDAFRRKGQEPFSAEEVKLAFADDRLQVFTDADDMDHQLRSQDWKQATLLLMSSGHFGGLKLEATTSAIVDKESGTGS